jgi:hypothetical protein
MSPAPSRRSLVALCAAGLAAGVVVPPVSAIVPTQLPPRSITHQNSQFWTWAGPRNWVSADGAYGIAISSGNGLLNLDYGFSSVLCANGTTLQESVTNYYAQQRAQLRQSLRANWRQVRLRASNIRQLPESSYGPTYFRQSFRVSGRARGTGFAGEIQLDYSLATGPTYCFSRNEARTAPAAGFRTSIRQLRSVQNSIAYFGPGVPGGSSGATDPDL